MNPYILIGIMLAIASSGAGGFYFGSDYKEKSIAAEVLRDKEAYEAGMLLVADSLAKVKVIQKTNNITLEREIRIEKQYAECRHSPEALKTLNEALTQGAKK